MVLSCKNIKKSFGIDVILSNISFHLNKYDKAALVGINGAGKTTLFRIITNQIEPDHGSVTLYDNSTIGYLAQEQNLVSDKTIYDELKSVFNYLFEIENKMRQIEIEMKQVDGDALQNLMSEYANLQHEFEKRNGFSYKSHIIGVLKGLGFHENEFNQTISTLSGGQKSRVCLAKLLLEKPSILLLDEPTNHLDIDAVTWLEDYLKNYKGTLLIISHDRYFLDKIVNQVIEIENGSSSSYNCNYTGYINQKQFNHDIQLRHYESQRREIKRQEEVIAKLRSFNREKSIKRAKSREKALEKIELIEKPININDQMNLTLNPRVISGEDVLHIEDLSKSFDNKKLFDSISFQIKRGDKIALIGANGIGKTTLFRIILKKLCQDSGTVHYGSRVKIGYYDQEHKNISNDNNIFEEISDAYPTMKNSEIRNTLAAFLFTGDDVFKPISSLSGGEKGRVSLAKIMLSEANFLLLDEPTNHLDIASREILESALCSYTGTIFFISHDRYFINKVATKVFEMTPQGMNMYLGNYNDYIEKKEFLSKGKESSKKESIKDYQKSTSKEEWLKQKEKQATIKRLENRITSCESSLEEIEVKIRELDNLLCLEEYYTDPIKAEEIHKEKIKLEAKLEELYIDWEEFNNELSELKKEDQPNESK